MEDEGEGERLVQVLVRAVEPGEGDEGVEGERRGLEAGECEW